MNNTKNKSDLLKNKMIKQLSPISTISQRVAALMCKQEVTQTHSASLVKNGSFWG